MNFYLFNIKWDLADTSRSSCVFSTKSGTLDLQKKEQRKKQLLEEYKNRPGLSLTHISPDGSVRKEQLKSQVFRPGHNQPTMGLEEFADMEVADAMAR